MFDDLHIRTVTEGENTYIHALDFAQHLVYVSIDMQNMPAAEDEATKAMDYAAIATLRMVANLLLKAEDVEYMRNHLDTFDDFLSLAGIDNPDDL
mgnify:FL=1